MGHRKQKTLQRWEFVFLDFYSSLKKILGSHYGKGPCGNARKIIFRPAIHAFGS